MPERVFIFQADIYCEECGNAIRDRITTEGQAPENPDDEYSYDSDEFPKGPYDNGGGESDTPQHCAECHMPLLNDLTVDGVDYVIEELKEYVETPGQGNGGVLNGWADQLDDYSLDEDQKFVLLAFKRIFKLEQTINLEFE